MSTLSIDEDYFDPANTNWTLSPNDLTDLDHYYNRTSVASIFFHILYGLIGLVGLGGNALVIYVVTRFSKMRTVTNSYVLCLALADQLFLIGIPVLIGIIHVNHWPLGLFMCKIFQTATNLGQISSSLFILVIAGDRYFVICHSIKALKWRTPLLAKMVALVTWIVSGLIVLPIFLYAQVLEHPQGVECAIFWPESSTFRGSTLYLIYFLIFGFSIPFTLIATFYVLVLVRLKKVEATNTQSSSYNAHRTIQRDAVTIEFSSSSSSGTSRRSTDRKLSHKKVTNLVLSLITVYFVCWFPFWLIQIEMLVIPSARHFSTHGIVLLLIATALAYANSAINPFLYAFISDDFKTTVLNSCCFPRWFGVPSGNFVTARRSKSMLDDDEDEIFVSTQELKPLDSTLGVIRPFPQGPVHTNNIEDA